MSIYLSDRLIFCFHLFAYIEAKHSYQADGLNELAHTRWLNFYQNRSSHYSNLHIVASHSFRNINLLGKCVHGVALQHIVQIYYNGKINKRRSNLVNKSDIEVHEATFTKWESAAGCLKHKKTDAMSSLEWNELCVCIWAHVWLCMDKRCSKDIHKQDFMHKYYRYSFTLCKFSKRLEEEVKGNDTQQYFSNFIIFLF